MDAHVRTWIAGIIYSAFVGALFEFVCLYSSHNPLFVANSVLPFYRYCFLATAPLLAMGCGAIVGWHYKIHKGSQKFWHAGIATGCAFTMILFLPVYIIAFLSLHQFSWEIIYQNVLPGSLSLPVLMVASLIVSVPATSIFCCLIYAIEIFAKLYRHMQSYPHD